MSEHFALLPEYLIAHIQLTLLALLLSTGISIPLGILATRSLWLERVALGLAGIVQTVPSLALLAIMVPILAGLELPSIGFLPAIIGLTLYGVLPVLRNTVIGISSVDPALKEAAQGVGMTPWQQLVRVELPLAMPVIVAGIRTATVWIVGVATLSTPVGATSLGNYIFSGLQIRNYQLVLLGCVSAALLALSLDALVRTAEVGLRRRRRLPLVLASLALVLLYSMTALSFAVSRFDNQKPPIVVGAKTFTEQYILSEIISGLIEQETGRSTRVIQSLGSMVAFDAITSGEIDLYVDYSGTIWVNEMNRSHDRSSRDEMLVQVEQYLKSTHGLTMAARLGFENAYTLAVRAEDANRLDLQNISDLTVHAPSLTIGGDYEFFARPEWTVARDVYDLRFADLRTMDSTLMYQAVAQHNVDVVSAFSSDGRIASYDLVALNDDLGAIPPYDALLLASRRLTEEEPLVVKAISQLHEQISIDRMRNMNLQVDASGETPTTVANQFLRRLKE